MASYAVHMRIEGVRPTRPRGTTRHSATTIIGTTPLGPMTTSDPAPAPAPAPVDLIGRSPGEVVAERWLRIREACGQATFFLFDPDSWR